MMRLVVSVALALVLGVGANADPLPDGVAAPGAPDAPVQPDKSQPPPVMEQHDVPPVAPPDPPAQEAKPDAEKPSAEASPQAPEEQQAPKDEARKDEAPKNVQPVAPSQAFSILGKKVHGPDGKDAYGSIIDVLVDDQGQPRAAIIDFGGFLGVGSRKIAVDWQLLKFNPADQAVPVMLDLDRGQIQAAPEYKDPTQPAEVVEPALVEIPPVSPVPDIVETQPPPDTVPADGPPLAPPIVVPRSIAAPAPLPLIPPPDPAAPPNADKHAD